MKRGPIKYYYVVGMTKTKLKDLGATSIIPVSFNYMYGLHPGHDYVHGKFNQKTKSARNEQNELVEWAFSSEPEILLSIKLLDCDEPIEITGRQFKCLNRGEQAGINITSKLHPKLAKLRYQSRYPAY